MQIDNIVFQQDERNRPGRLSLVQVQESFFQQNASSGGADITIDLPRPAAGFGRRWEHVAISMNVFAANDIITFTRIIKDQTSGTMLAYVQPSFPSGAFAYAWPLVGGRISIGGSGGNFIFVQGIDAFIAGQDEILRVFVDYVAPVAQTVSVTGWYKDIPI